MLVNRGLSPITSPLLHCYYNVAVIRSRSVHCISEDTCHLRRGDGMYAATQRPDLGRLYCVGTTAQDTTPVIVIPGVFGSKLPHRGTGEEIWPGSACMLLFGGYREIALDFDPQTLRVKPDDYEAFDIADAALGHDFYGQLLSALQRFGGYVRSTPGTAPTTGERFCWARRTCARRRCCMRSSAANPSFSSASRRKSSPRCRPVTN